MAGSDEIWVCLSGGNALGAFQAGAVEAVIELGLDIRAICGASIGALNAAIIAGNPPEQRLARLRAFWEEASQPTFLSGFKEVRIAEALRTALMGRAGLFHQHLLGSNWLGARKPAVHDNQPTRARLERLIDLGYLNSGAVRLVLTAADVETGQIASFDSHRQMLGLDHLMASIAAPVLFPPVTIDGRTYVDPGLVCNLPLEPLFAPLPDHPVTCLALDTACATGPVPTGIDAAFSRAQDILFSAQSARAIETVRGRFLSRSDGNGTAPRCDIRHIQYDDGKGIETGLKAMDFSDLSIAARWARGRALIMEGLGEGRQASAT